MPLTTGQIINNRYRIVRLLGEGGFGAVYRAWDTNVNEPVALKESLDISPEAVRQFQVEARILFKLRHPHLPVVHDVFLIPNQGQYLVMDYIEGEDLEAKAAGASLPEQQCIRWVLQICEALEYLHSQSPPIIHRDIKPANIRINSLGQAILVDFGLAKVYNPLLRTTQGARAVTPGYSPIEQYGQAATDPRSDVYALGATFYTLLTGDVPQESVLRSAGMELPLPRTLNPQISLTSEACILSAMALKREDRPQTIAQFRHALTTPAVQAATDPLVLPFIQADPAELHTALRAVSPLPEVPSNPIPKRKVKWTWAVIILLLLVFVSTGAGLWLRSANQKAAATAQLRLTDEAWLPTATQEESALSASQASQSALPQPTSTKQPELVEANTPSPTPDAPQATATSVSTLRPTGKPRPTATPTPEPYQVVVQVVNDYGGKLELWMDCKEGPCVSKAPYNNYYHGKSNSYSFQVWAGTYQVIQIMCGVRKDYSKILTKNWTITVYKCK